MQASPSLASFTTGATPLRAASTSPKTLPAAMRTYVAWRFDRVMPGSFIRNKAQFAHHVYPVLGPLPTAARNTPELERSRLNGPYMYFVCDDQDRVRYVGKSLEDRVLQRWIRPGIGGPARHYWTHSTASGGCVFNIEKGLQSHESAHYTLRYVPVAEVPGEVWEHLGVSGSVDPGTAERAFISALCADWNRA